ncbi:hypothetical protein BurJV3_2159 [Stenotrophomonas maltophilia JV3]|nr:hypothetical protein BurJV3_2159 [Stenotrophomonas maltophilia JV3]
MNITHRKTLLVALLACLAPAAASAAEAYLTPSRIGGSGTMPSGYSKLYFELANGDWVNHMQLPANPQPADFVVVSSLAKLSSRLDTARTAFSDLLYLPIDTYANVELRWSKAHQRWDVVDGLSARGVVARGDLIVPQSEHAVTQVYIGSKLGPVSMLLPAAAPQGAVLAVANDSAHAVGIGGGEIAGGHAVACPAARACAFVFNSGDGKWHARYGRGQIKPTEYQLPMPTRRWTNLVTGSAASDLTMPLNMRMPDNAVDGDIYQLTDPSNSNGFWVEGAGNKPLSAIPVTLRYDATRRTWLRQF